MIFLLDGLGKSMQMTNNEGSGIGLAVGATILKTNYGY